jgi:hypothetical protein
MTLTASVFPLFEQIGIYNDFLSISKPNSKALFFNEKGKIIGSIRDDTHLKT